MRSQLQLQILLRTVPVQLNHIPVTQQRKVSEFISEFLRDVVLVFTRAASN